MSKSLVVFAVSSLITAGLSFVKLNKELKKVRNQVKNQNEESKQINDKNDIKPILTQNYQTEEEHSTSSDVRSAAHRKQRKIFQNGVFSANTQKIFIKKPINNQEISNIKYYILLNLNKTYGYQGVTKIKFSSYQKINKADMLIDFKGDKILSMYVNQKQIQEQQVILRKNQIIIRKQWLREYQNEIQIIFYNRYSFMGDGLNCYYPLDLQNKYSLKGQVLYTSNGSQKISKIIPCLNIRNKCDIHLQVIHPQKFNVESNNYKSCMKLVSRSNYPQYAFLFDNMNSSLSSSRFTASTLSQPRNIKVKKIQSRMKTQFHQLSLSSIHSLFIFCSSVIQARPSKSLSKIKSKSDLNKQILNQVNIRYFTKQNLVEKAGTFLSILQSQLLQIFRKIQEYANINNKMPKYQGKIDIIFVDDINVEGDFYPGVILLCQKTIDKGFIDRELQYLLCRAILGMALQLKKKLKFLKFQQIIKLNQLTLQIFPECCDFICVKNKEYESIRQQCIKLMKQISNKQAIKENNQDDLKSMEMIYWILQYYSKQCRYIIANPQKFIKNISINVHNVLQGISEMRNDEYWTFFNARYPFIQFMVGELLIKISLALKGCPISQHQIKFAKKNYIRSKYYLKFFTLQQIKQNIKVIIELKCQGIQEYLPLIRFDQSELQLIPQSLGSYLNLSCNRVQAMKLYEQFKKYNQQNNFHHRNALYREIRRVSTIASEHIKQERRALCCSLSSWKLLQNLKIYPKHPQTYQLICSLQRISCKENDKKKAQQQKIEQNLVAVLKDF